MVWQVGTHQGLVGHAMLTYPSGYAQPVYYQLINASAGGCLSVTCAQWADLSDYEVNEDAFFQVSQNWMVILGYLRVNRTCMSDGRVMVNSLCGIRYAPSCMMKTTASD